MFTLIQFIKPGTSDPKPYYLLKVNFILNIHIRPCTNFRLFYNIRIFATLRKKNIKY